MPTLSWIGKEAVVNHHREVPFHLLKDVPELSSGAPGAGNLIVQGDNLVALKALLPYYAGQVKCIYIDPPYNTGDESWIYNDNVSSPVITETGEPLPETAKPTSPFLGVCRGVGVYLLYNGILGDKSRSGGNILTRALLATLPPFEGQKVIYCAGCLLGAERLRAERVIIRQTPYEIRVS